MDVLLLVNMAIGLVAGGYVLWYGLTRANGKKPIRVTSGVLILIFALGYGLVILGQLDGDLMGPVLFRPIISLLFLMPVWECMAEHGNGGHA
jgi:hypothetical protein